MAEIKITIALPESDDKAMRREGHIIAQIGDHAVMRSFECANTLRDVAAKAAAEVATAFEDVEAMQEQPPATVDASKAAPVKVKKSEPAAEQADEDEDWMKPQFRKKSKKGRK